ncbi:TonB-dependent receptor [Brevundimonas sp.]|uniref:TonB-dependent receptor n=1 Tax=Brevundimonas sp. TaxID=1871086 RepID=UPI0026063B73|nr:TonB-dependent receptor [Brevundimonas sp.]
MSHFKISKLAWLLAGTAVTTLAGAASAAEPDRAAEVIQTAPAQVVASDDQLDEIVVIGSGETRSVSTLTSQNLDVLPPGTSIQKALNYLPGVMAQSIDALGVNEQSLSLQVRGYSTTHLGYSLDGMPLGDGAYNNYNGLTISRALISENLGRADLTTGIAGLSIPSTSNLGGALIYTSRNPARDMGFTASQSLGSENTQRSFLRLETGEHGGFSAYVSAQYSEQDLFVNQPQYNTSWGKQLNAKAIYDFGRGRITAFADLSRTNQADDAYLSKDMLNRLGPDWGGYAPDWSAYLGVAACSVPSLAARCVPAVAPRRNSDVTFTNGQILRDDDLYYLAADLDVTADLSVRGQVYTHTDKGAGNNFITGLSTQGTASTADDLPVQIRDTRYTIDRSGVLGSATWAFGMHEIEAGFWLEENTSSAARYIRNDVTGPFSLAHFLGGQPASAQWVQETEWETRQFYVQDTVSLLNDAVTVEFGFKSTWSESNAFARPGIAVTAPPASSQFATGSLTAEDNFLPQIGVHWQVAPGHELYASYSENIAMYQGGFKLGPQSVSQAIWDLQGATLKPETSQSLDAGYRYVSGPLQVSVAAYHMLFADRLLQYNPCPTNQQQNPGCGNSFHNAGGVTSNGFEMAALWRATDWLTWYNSVSINETTYDEDLNFCTATCVLKATAGKQQVDTPKEMVASVLTLDWNGFSASLAGKYTGERFYTYTNDQGFDAVTTFDLGLSYDFDNLGAPGSRFSVNVTNLTNERYASNFDSSVFAPDDAAGSIVVFHTSAPRQVFATLTVAY